ncbi:hypothetical protein JAAARDRAFT_90222, partial [Jaapia argillacea MUCL 33604]
HPLAYIEWFTPFNKPDVGTGMMVLSRSTHNHRQNAAVISMERIIQSCHLMGKLGWKIDP